VQTVSRFPAAAIYIRMFGCGRDRDLATALSGDLLRRRDRKLRRCRVLTLGYQRDFTETTAHERGAPEEFVHQRSRPGRQIVSLCYILITSQNDFRDGRRPCRNGLQFPWSEALTPDERAPQ